MAVGSEKCRVSVLNLGRVIPGRAWAVGDDYGFCYRNSLGKHHVVKLERAKIVRVSARGPLRLEVREFSPWDGAAF